MSKIKIAHPYIELENSTLWKIVKSAIDDLIINKDLELQTKEEYVIGYICKAVASSNWPRSSSSIPNEGKCKQEIAKSAEKMSCPKIDLHK